MVATNFDVIINGVKARISQEAEGGGGYKRRTVRREIQNQLLSQSEAPTLRNRDDGVALYQTSWAGGARWWKPLITAQDLASYFQGNHMDVWSEPGKVVPGNKDAVFSASTDLHNNCVIGVGADGEVFAIGKTFNVTFGRWDVYKWTPASNDFVQETGYDSGISTSERPLSIIYDPSDGYFYTVSNGSDIERFNPDTPAQSVDWITAGFTANQGSAIFLQNQNLMLYDGENLYTVDKSGPSVTSVFEDGMGPDFLEEATAGTTGSIFRSVELAIATPEGIYYVKNTRQGGRPVPWVFRVDRDVAGNWLGNPIATLPAGTVALDLAYHLGQLVISTTPDWQGIVENGSNDVEVVLYFVGEGGMGTLGSLLGSRDEVDETPFALLGTDGPLLYLAGSKRLWIYDAVRGGVHTEREWQGAPLSGPYKNHAVVTDSDGDSCNLYLGDDTLTLVKFSRTDDPDTVTDFGDDETHYVLESNFFDGGLPMEEKQITRVAILRDKDDGGSEWTVQLSADGGAFADALVHSGTGLFAEASPASVSGYQFRYKLIYQTKDAARSALRALLVEMATGDMVTEWDLTLDGSSLRNLGNQPQNPETFYDSMVTLGNEDGIVALIDNYQEHERGQDSSGSGIRVKVVAVEIAKDTPGESNVRVLLREA